MPEFSYTTIAQDGHQSSGTLTATNREAAIAMLRDQGAKPILVKPSKAKKKRLGLGKKVKIKDLVIFTRELSTMVSAGVPLPRALNTLADQTENKYFKTVLASVDHDVESGLQLAEAMSKFPDVFSEVYINMVKAGEAGGILDEIMKRLATQVEKDSSIKNKVRAAMAYPVVIMVITVVAFFGIMVFVMPKIGKIIKDLGGPDAQLPIYSRMLLSASDFMQKNFIYILVVFFTASWLFRHYIKTDKGKYWWHQTLLKTPVIGKVLVKIAVARFSRTFASLMGSGVTVLEALEVTGKAVGNRVIQKELQEISENVKNGQPLGKQLLAAKYFPPVLGQMVTVGEETGKISEILLKVADFYEEEVDTVIDSLASIIEPIMIVILGAMVGLIAASVMGPIAGLSKNIGG